ncbi:MAG: glycosyltransferase family 39 protein [Gemmatimonadaceae bacterium]
MVTLACFVAFLVVGLGVYRDYGISWDEVPTREFGMMNVRGVIPDVVALDSLRAEKGPAFERFGPLFEIVLVHAEDVLHLTDSQSIFFTRHLLTFLTFYLGVVLFYLFCRRRFDWGISLLAAACLVLTPQMFSHAFFNTKDISFLTAFVAAVLTLDVMLARPEWRRVLLHGVVTALLMGTRVIGLFAMMLTGMAAFARHPTWRTVGLLAAYGVVVAVLLPVVWPVLRIDPVGILKDAVLGATANPYTRTDLFRGQTIPANQLPWDYIPTWIAITTPLVISLLFVVGTARTVAAVVTAPARFLREEQRDVIVLSWFLLPVAGTVVLRPIMYDGWRHLYFVYPAMVYLAAVGMELLARRARPKLRAQHERYAAPALVALLLLGLAPSTLFMIRNHPHEHLYFNRLAGSDMQQIKSRFELDYWGLSYRRALEYIVSSDRSSTIRVQAANYPGIVNSLMLPAHERARIRFVSADSPADYFVTNYRFHPEPYPLPDEVFSVRVGNASIASVFRLRRAP